MEKAYKLEFAGEQAGPLSVSCCGCSKTEPLHSFGPALKPHFLIHFVLSGKGKFCIDKKEYFLEAGHGFLIEPGELAFYQADEKDPWTYVWVGFSGNLAADYIKKIGLSGKRPVFSSDKRDQLYACVRNMMEHNTSGIANDLRRNGELAVFLSLIASGISAKDNGGQDKANAYVRKAVGFIQSNYCYPIKVTDVADFVCVNRSYLYTLFQNSLNMSPQKFLSTYRITQAAELLQTTEIPVESIAMSCGYNDALVFSKAFHQMKGMSPSRYRREMQKGETRHSAEQLLQIEAFIRQIQELNNGAGE